MTKPPVQPLFENVLCLREEEEKYAGSLILPETAKERPMGARVLDIGGDVKVIKEGDFVLVGRYAGAEVTFKHQTYLVLRESEVLGIVREEK